MNKKSWFDVFNSICSAITALAALFALVVVLYPQIKPSNANHIELANAGVVDSQIFLANHYYEIGDLSQSIYWYSVASQAEGEYQAKAINNLAFIYLTSESINKTYQNKSQDAMNMFKNAAELGEVDAAKNLYILLISNPREQFGAEYPDVLSFSKNILTDNGIDIALFEKYQTQWNLIETVTGDHIPKDSEEYQYREVAADLVISDGQCHWIYTYATYQKITATSSPEYTYIS